MRRIVPDLWEISEIGSQVHCYLWKWQEGYSLIDTGYPRDARTIIDALIAAQCPMHMIKRIIVTHADLDHSGGLATLQHATQAKVVCHAVEKDCLKYPYRRQPAAIFMRPLFWMTCLVPGFRLSGVEPDELVVDGQMLPEGFMVVHTPGHSPGHISLLHRERRLLITGDAMSNRGGKLRVPLFLYTPDGTNAKKSIWKLAKRYGDDYETVVFGHGPPILKNGGKRVKAFASRIFSMSI